MGVEVVRAPDHETLTVVKFAVAETDDGGVGRPTAASVKVMTFEGMLVPATLFAVTRKLFVTPGVRPSMRAERYMLDCEETTAQVTPASVERHTSYDVTAVPPFVAGELHET